MIRYKRLNESYPVKNGDKFVDNLYSCVNDWERDALRNLAKDFSKYTDAFADEINSALANIEDEEFTFDEVETTEFYTVEASFIRNNKQPVDKRYCEKILSEIKKELKRPSHDAEDWRFRSLHQEDGIRLGLFIGQIDVVEGDRENEFVVEIKLKPIWEYLF